MTNNSAGGVPVMDFSTIGELGKTWRNAGLEGNRQRTLVELAQSAGPLDYERAARSLFAGGDMQGGLSLARLAQRNVLPSDAIGLSRVPKANAADVNEPEVPLPRPPSAEDLGKFLPAAELAQFKEVLRVDPLFGRRMQVPLAVWARATQDIETDMSPRNLALLGVASHRLSASLREAGVDVPPGSLVRSVFGSSATPVGGGREPAAQGG